MRPPFARRTILLLILGLVLAGALWVGWLAWRVNSDLNAAVDDAERLQTALEAGDDAGVDEALDDLQDHSTSAADRTDGLTWSVLTHIPHYGDDAEGVRLVSDVIADLSNDGIEPLVRTASDIDNVIPSGGQVDLEALEELRGPVREARAALEEADRRLAGGDPVGYVNRLKTKYRELASRVSSAAESVTSADRALQVMPTMLGGEEPRQYLLVFQNNAEIRATGGLPGAVSLVEAHQGKLRITRQVAANSFGRAPAPVLPLTEAEMAMYGPELGTFFLDANFTPDFPRTADLMKARWEQVYDEDLDGVVSLDPVVLSYVLDVLGPVSVGDFTLSGDNVVDVLLHEVYLRYADPAEQDAYFRKVAKAVFDKISSGADDPLALIRALARGAHEGRVYVHSFRQSEQSSIAGSDVTGELLTEASGTPQINVTMNDATGAKMSYYLRSSVHVDSTYCSGGVQGFSGKAQLQSIAPPDAASLPDYVTGGGQFGIEPGAQLVLLRIFGPVGGDVKDLRFNGKSTGLDVVDQDGRQVATTTVYLEPGQTIDVSWRMTTGPEQRANAQVTVTPSIEEKRSSFTVPTSCA